MNIKERINKNLKEAERDLENYDYTLDELLKIQDYDVADASFCAGYISALRELKKVL